MTAGEEGRRKALRNVVLAALVGVAALAPAADAAEAQQGARHHVLQVWDPSAADLEAVGCLTQALGDAGIANEYAGFAAGDVDHPGDLASMKTHARNVLHTLDPDRVEEGPGFGFGVVPSARSVLEHLRMATASPDATANVRTHAEHVATSVRNTLERAERMVGLIHRIQAARSAEDARPLARELEAVARELRNGRDADGDGSVTWHEGEGGLYEAERHVRLLAEAEGLGGDDGADSTRSPARRTCR